MLLVLALVQGQDTGRLLDNRISCNLRATYIPTVSGLLQENNVAILEVMEENVQLGDVLEIIQKNCHARSHLVNPILDSANATGMVFLPSPVQVEVGGATVFVFEVLRFERV